MIELILIIIYLVLGLLFCKAYYDVKSLSLPHWTDQGLYYIFVTPIWLILFVYIIFGIILKKAYNIK